MKNDHAKITVVPLGPGSSELLTFQSAEELKKPKQLLVLRTARHPVSAWLEEQGVPFESLDSFYDLYEDFEAMHGAMAAWLWKKAEEQPVCFGVMDPAADGAVQALKKECPENAVLRILPGVTAADQEFSSLPGSQGVSGAVQLFTATGFLSRSFDPSVPILLTEVDSRLLAGQIKLRLTELFPDETEICFFAPGDSAKRTCRVIPLFRLDSGKHFDHTCAVFVPGLDCLQRTRFTFQDLEKIVSRLCAPDGCPWDRVQTHESLRPYLVEEAWEAVNAIEDQDPDHLADELGDVLFQVFIHASIGQRYDEFSLTDVLSGICSKMIRRHPHVFGSQVYGSSASVSEGWEALKRGETGSKTVGETLDTVSQALPSLKYSIKMYKKLAQLPAFRRPPEEISKEIRLHAEKLEKEFRPEEMALLLMKCTELCYREDQDAEIILHRGVETLKKQYQKAENAIFADEKRPENLTFQELRVYLKQVEDEIE